MPLSIRCSGGSSPLSGTRRPGFPLGRLAPLAPDSGAAAASSTMAFHSPQLSQRPAHLPATEPQAWQTKRS